MTLSNNPIKVVTSDTIAVDIFIAGSRAAAVEACREFCMEGLCVTVTDADYVYTGGMETGVKIGLINYPRFPGTEDEIYAVAYRLAVFLIERLFQQSCTIVSPSKSVWLTRRGE